MGSQKPLLQNITVGARKQSFERTFVVKIHETILQEDLSLPLVEHNVSSVSEENMAYFIFKLPTGGPKLLYRDISRHEEHRAIDVAIDLFRNDQASRTIPKAISEPL
ncbi:hypothetical protein [Asaia astilbis]|uniref:hypothetical protein n=1 Tax=Asaia astilbis TaxID=610244 RepID=UPI0004714D0F|nr:hypothetical protein [Asaia astilbis]